MSVPSVAVRYRVNNIPADLRALDRWVVFALEGNGARRSKVPYVPGSNTKARSNDPATWRPFNIALADAERRGLYLGFCFTPDLGMTFLDFDGVLGAGGAVKQYASLFVDTLDSYSEASLNGGVHVFVRGRPPENFATDLVGGKVEVYPQSGGRFCLVTGNTRPGLGSLDGAIEERTVELATLLPARPRTVAATPNGTGAHLTPDETDAIVAALAPAWTLGQKHDMGLAVGGILARNGVPEAQALAIVERLSVDDDKPRDRAKAVRDSYARAGSGLDIRGYQALRDMVEPGALATIDGVLTRIWRERQPQLVRASKVRPAEEEPSAWAEWPDPPEDAIHGWFRGYLDLMEPTTEAPPAFHLASALTIAGAVIGKRIRTEYASEPLFANLYTVLIGPSGSSRKDTAIKRALSLSWPPQWERQVVSMPYQTVTDVSSAEGLIKSLKRGPNTLLYLTELSNLMRNARRKGTSTILPRLIEAFDTPAKLSNLSKGDPEEVTDPYLSIIAATQPGILSAEMGVEDIHSGFANRWLFVPGDRRERKPTPPKLDKAASWHLWQDLNEAVLGYGPGVALAEADDVQAVWDTWYLKERSRTEEEGSLSVRHPVLVRKIALILAVTDKAKRIELIHVRAAIAFVDWMWEQTRRLMADWGVGADHQLENRVLEVLAKQGPMKKWQLQQKTKNRKWSAIEFDRVIRAMQSNQTLAFDGDGRIGITDE